MGSSGLVETMYKVDPDNNKKMVPNSPAAFEYMEAVAPADDTVVERASYVIINVGHATKYEFLYESDGGYIDYGIITAVTGPVRVDIQPIAWKGGAGATGNITFVYKRSSAGN